MPKFAVYDATQQENTKWKATVEGMLLTQKKEQEDLMMKQTETVAGLKDLYDVANQSISEINTTLQNGLPGPSGEKKKDWQMTRPKDMVPAMFSGKDEEWPQWKESVEDDADAIHPGLKELLKRVAKKKEEVSEATVRKEEGFVEGQWSQRSEVFSLLKTKTVPLSEARTIVMCADRENGYEAWRTLTIRFEPQTGIRRMKEVSDLTQFQNQICKMQQKPR